LILLAKGIVSVHYFPFREFSGYGLSFPNFGLPGVGHTIRTQGAMETKSYRVFREVSLIWGIQSSGQSHTQQWLDSGIRTTVPSERLSVEFTKQLCPAAEMGTDMLQFDNMKGNGVPRLGND
jgi:hypothetical protein